MNTYMVFPLSVLVCILSSVIKKRSPEFSLVIVICAVTSMFLASIELVSEILSSVESFEIVDTSYFEVPIKLLGITILAKICSSVCEDAGEKGLSVTIQTITRFVSIFIAFPLFEILIEQIRTVMTI